MTTALAGDVPGMAPREAAAIVLGTSASLAFAAWLLTRHGGDVAATQWALRMTARVSFVYFMLAFVAAPVQRLWPGAVGAFLVRWRRAFGVIFGASMSVHVVCILRLYALHAPERPPMVTDADFLIGLPGLLVVAAMTLTSFAVLRRRLGAAAWHRLHGIGIYVVWAIFFLCLVDSVSRKDSPHPVLEYYPFIAVLLAGMALRWRARNGLAS